MTAKDTITLPREVVQEAVKALEFAERNHDGEQSLYTTEIAALRKALAAEPTKQEAKQEPVAYFDLQKQVFYWARPTMIDVPMTVALNPLPLYTAPPAAAPSEDIDALRQELAAVLSDWNSLVCASGSSTNGGAVGHVAALRRDAERYRWLRGEHSRIDPCIKANAKYKLERQSSTWVEIHDLDASIDAAIKEDKT
jgi:hypothetical protein